MLLGGLRMLLRFGLSVRYPAEPAPVPLRNTAVCIPVVVCYLLAAWPARYGLSSGAVLLAGSLYPGIHGRLLDREAQLLRYPPGYHRSNQSLSAISPRQHRSWPPKPGPAHRDEPLSYYHRKGPIGQVFTYGNEAGILKNVGIVGLGAGSLAAYGQPGQSITYYEIDPVVKRIALDDHLFTFMTKSKAKMNVVLGDARLTLADAPDGRFDLLVLDAFTSDAIPMHLMTREALMIYKASRARGYAGHQYLEPLFGSGAGNRAVGERGSLESLVTDVGRLGRAEGRRHVRLAVDAARPRFAPPGSHFPHGPLDSRDT